MWKRFGGSHRLQVKQCNLHDVLTKKTPFEENLTKMVVVRKRKVGMHNKHTKKRWSCLFAFVFSGIQVSPRKGLIQFANLEIQK